MHFCYAKIVNGVPVFPNNKENREYFAKHEGKDFIVEMKRERGVRTDNQNRSLHLFCTMLANALNDAGYSVQMVLKEKVELNWTPQNIKEILWRPAQIALTGKKSTTELSKIEDIELIHSHLMRHLGEKFGLEYIQWPSEQTRNEETKH